MNFVEFCPHSKSQANEISNTNSKDILIILAIRVYKKYFYSEEIKL
jgi:hypothetical protein